MTKNPFLNALAASAYIVLIVFGISNGAAIFGPTEDIIIPIFMLSLFVFSAALMGYVFLYHPLIYFFDGKKKDAVALFIQTIAVFAGITLVLVLGWLTLVR